MPTEMELTLEQTQQGVSYEVSVDPTDSDTLKLVVKIKEFQEDATLKLSNQQYQERYEHCRSEVTSPQDAKFKMAERGLCLVDESQVASRSQCKIQVQGTSSILKIALDFEDSRARGFVHRPLDLLSFACLYMGIRYPGLIMGVWGLTAHIETNVLGSSMGGIFRFDLTCICLADGAQSSRVPVPLPKDPYEAIKQAYLVGTDTKSEPIEDLGTESPESPYIVASPISFPDGTPPVGHVEESEGSDTSGAGSTSSNYTTPLSPDHPLTHDTPVLVPSLRRTARMAVRVQPTMSPGCSARIAKVAAMSDVAFRKRFRSLYESSPSPSPTLPVRKRSEGVEDEGSAAGDEDPGIRDEGFGLGEDEVVPEGQQRDHTQRLDALPPTLFAEIDRDVRDLYTRSEAVSFVEARAGIGGMGRTRRHPNGEYIMSRI
ncbi:hypothetical protein Tco_0761932 [Tanacetum coccineum]